MGLDDEFSSEYLECHRLLRHAADVYTNRLHVEGAGYRNYGL